MNAQKKKERKELHKTIISLPVVESSTVFDNTIQSLINNRLLDAKDKEYLERKCLNAKGYQKAVFCCGMCSSSRIESKHNAYKFFLKSSKRLGELFTIFRKLEVREIMPFKDEVQYIPKSESKRLDKSNLNKYPKGTYSNFVTRKMKDVMQESLNYTIEKKSHNLWYEFFRLNLFM